jgi:hypothetical protein
MKARLVWSSLLVGCFSAPRWTEGPPYPPPAAPAGFAIIYVYRETVFTSALSPVLVRSGDRNVDVLSGSYAVVLAKPGVQHVRSICAAEHVDLVMWAGLAPRFHDAAKPVDLELTASLDKPVFVRVACESLGATSARVVPSAEGEAAIASLSLAPGGRARVVWDDL